MNSRRLVELLALLALVGFYARMLGPVWILSPDSTAYLEGAQSLASVHRYQDMNGDPMDLIPPGTSILYTPAAAVASPGDYTWFNATTLGLTVALVVLVYLSLRRSFGTSLALGLSCWLALSQSLMGLGVMSDVPYLAWLAGTLFCFPVDRLKQQRPRDFLLLGLMLGFGCQIRRTGYCVLAAYSLWMGLRKSMPRRLLVLCIGSAAAVYGLTAAATGGSGLVHGQVHRLKRFVHRQEWIEDSPRVTPGDLWGRFTRDVPRLLEHVSLTMANRGGTVWPGVLLVGIALVGARRDPQVDTDGDLHRWIVACYGLPLLFVELTDPRYILPLLPSFLYFVARAWRRLRPRTAAVGLCGYLLATGFVAHGWAVAQQTRTVMQDLSYGGVRDVGHEDFQRLVERNNPRLRPDDIVATPLPNVLRHLVPVGVDLQGIKFDSRPALVMQGLLRVHPAYVYLDLTLDVATDLIEPVLRAHPDTYLVLGRTDHAVLYRVRGGMK